MPIATSKVTNRRKVQYTSLQDVLADAERLSRGNFNTLGNWSAGQIFMHLAKSMNDSIDGSDMRLPWYLEIARSAITEQAAPRPDGPWCQAARERRQGNGTGPDVDRGRLDGAAVRDRTPGKRIEARLAARSWVPMTKDEWNRLHLNHSTLHMSFLVPQ